MDIPDYKIQNRDVIYITLKSMNSEGEIVDYLIGRTGGGFNSANLQSDAGGYLWGYNVDKDGNILLPVLGFIHVSGKTLDEIRTYLQVEFDKSFKNAVLECKLLSFKYTVIGEVNSPGSYINYSNYLTILEAIGQAGGISDLGRRYDLLVVRPVEGGSKTFRLNLQDKSILSSEAYFLLPNDVVIVEPENRKIFNINFGAFATVFGTALSVLSTTLLLINYLGSN
jgi:polysaccharide export outer membrane protein